MNTPTMEIPVPTLEALNLDKFTASGRPAGDLITRRQSLKDEIELCEQEIKDLDTELGVALDLVGAKNAVYNDYLLIRRKGSKPRASLDRVLLLDAGVTPQQLEAGTKFSQEGSPGITVQSISKGSPRGYVQDVSDIS